MASSACTSERNRTVRFQLALQLSVQLDLVVSGEARDGVEHRAHGEDVHSDEGVEVHRGEQGHEQLAVHAVHDAPVPRDGLLKVLHLVCALDGRREVAAKGRDERRKDPKPEAVHLDGEGLEAVTAQHAVEELREVELLGHEEREARAEVVHLLGVAVGYVVKVRTLAHEAGPPHEHRGGRDGPDDGEDAAADEALPRLVGG
mmetsp:Transcript_2373/g.7850  ORF Transcript_2373/g.7850 Transcript_2373/m.7850 type:complete len:202 (-) Transcript_2373:162-767(-)